MTSSQVQIELAHQPVTRADAIEAHVRMPALGVVLGDRHPEEPFDQPEQTVQHAGQRKVLLHLPECRRASGLHFPRDQTRPVSLLKSR